MNVKAFFLQMLIWKHDQINKFIGFPKIISTKYNETLPKAKT